MPAYIYFFHLFSTPKFSRLLPTTYLPPPTHHLPTPPPSLHRQSSRDVERERAWRSELGAGDPLEPEREPRGTQVSILLFFLVYFPCLFVELHCTRYVALQRSITKKAVVVAFFSPLRGSYATAQLPEGGDDSDRRLLLPVAELRCSAAPGRRLPSPPSPCCSAAPGRR